MAEEIEIQPAVLRDLLENGDPAGGSVTLVDCREPEERELVLIEPSVHLPMSALPKGLDSLESVRDSQVVVYCHHGVRSQNVAAWLTEQGFSNVCSLAGGIDAWAVEVEPGMSRY